MADQGETPGELKPKRVRSRLEDFAWVLCTDRAANIERLFSRV
jgi:hypothetical protein